MNAPVQLAERRSTASATRSGAKRQYHALLGENGIELGGIDEVTRSTSRAFLSSALGEAALLHDDFPDDPRLLRSWLAQSHQQTTLAYREYLRARKAGAPRRFFRNRSHALHFIKSVAPTKLVDGAWLYGLLPRWKDHRLAPLIRVFLEELGDGIGERHHVLLYRRLLAVHGTDRWHDLSDDHYVQGAIQLALAHHGDELLPEVMGFNLGYEQLPLHLPITAYELRELGVDPYYFSLHVTIDNAATGHARRSLDSVLQCLPRAGDARPFYRRIATGFRLNDLGMGTMGAIASFDLSRELVAVLADKASVSAQLHSDCCRIAGRTVAEWLASSDSIPQFLEALVSTGWIRRGAEPGESRFWSLLHGDRAPMFGVFDEYERQLISDWIADAPPYADAVSRRPPLARFRSRGAIRERDASRARYADTGSEGIGTVIARQLATLSKEDSADEDVRVLVGRLADVKEASDAMVALRGFLSPANHPSPVGLLATRICSSMLSQ